MKTKTVMGTVLIALLLTACNNYFHELMPSDENRIVTFQLKGQLYGAEINENDVVIMMEKEALKAPLIPFVLVSPQATIVPLTFEYLTAAFPNVEMPKEAIAMYQTPDLNEFVLDLIENEPDFNIPPMNIPIDFSGPVGFVVVSGQGSVRQYTVYAVEDDGLPRLLNFGFSKYDNPELIRDALSRVDENKKMAGAQVLYPVDIYLSYALVPSCVILGDRLEVDGVLVLSGVTPVQFDPYLGMQSKTITVWRDGASVDYTLLVEFNEEADSLYSITDFRFDTGDNSSLVATAVGSIVDNENFGTITVQVFYSGARPSVMIPRFISPGKVSVGGAAQYSGNASHDFSQPVEYLVISQNDYYTRRYTVRVEFIDIAIASPVITAFSFSSAINPELVQDSKGEISDSGGIIMITARYGGANEPEFLIPHFSATGMVTVMGITQSSGYSSQDFSRQLRYTVSSPTNPLLARDYWVQVRFIHDTSSFAMIKTFSFHPAENPGLMDEVTGKIDQVAGTIIVNAPVGSGVVTRLMIPRFTADGQVFSGDAVQLDNRNLKWRAADGHAVQVSGASTMMFDVSVPYVAVSANGAVRKDYTVMVRELGTTIYVDGNALGLSNGTNWKDAFRTISQACEAAALFDEDVPKEIWIAKGNYTANGGNFNLTANTSYMGGFTGNETSKSQRNAAANKVNVQGSFRANAKVAGDVLFEHLYLSSGSIYVADVGGSVNINTVEVRDFYGTAINMRNGNLNINGLDLNNITGTGIQLYGSGNRTLSGINGRNISSDSVSTSGYTSGSLRISNSTFDSSGRLYLAYSSGYTVTTAIQGVTISNSKATSTAPLYISNNGSGAVNLDVTIPNAPALSYTIYYSGSSANFTIDKAVINNSQATGSAIYISAGSGIASVNNAQVTGASGRMGRGIQASSSNRMRITNSSFKNCTVAGNGAGIYLSGTGAAEISGTTIDNAKATGSYSNGGGIYADGAASLTVSGCSISNTSARYGGGIYVSCRGNVSVSDTYISNTQATNIAAGSSPGCGGGIYASTPRLTLSDVPFTNCYAGVFDIPGLPPGFEGLIPYPGSEGGGVYLDYTNGAILTIQGSNNRFENCRADSGGAIYNPSGAWGNDNYRPYNNRASIRGTTFRNCSAYEGQKIFHGEGTFTNCIFSDGTELHLYPETDKIFPMFCGSQNYSGGTGYFYFTNCSFTDLRDNNNKDNDRFVFNRWSRFTKDPLGDLFKGDIDMLILGSVGYDLTFRDCSFRQYNGNLDGYVKLKRLVDTGGFYAFSNSRYQADSYSENNCNF